MTAATKLALLCLGALAFRLLLLPLIAFPGIADPNHYYNMGVRLVQGHGFTIDYIWQYSLPPATIEHPEEHWMPLTATLAALPMAAFGVGVHTALLPFIVIGALLPALTYWASRQFGLDEDARLFTAAAAGFLPEFVLNSLRTDTTLPAALLTGLSILLLSEGLRGGRGWTYLASGAAAGLAYLTRSDAALLLPMLMVTLVVYRVVRRRTVDLRPALIVPLAALVVITPWLLRNLDAFGMATTPETRSMLFFTHHDDHYAYERTFTLSTLLAAQTPGEILGKRAFEMAAAVQMMIAALDGLAVAFTGGALLLATARGARRERLLALAPALILLGGAFVAYTLFLPYKAQAGSFKKAFLSLLPLLLPLAGYALAQALPDARLRRGAMLLIVALLAANTFQLVRSDARAASSYLASVQAMADAARALPDRTGDGEIRLMTQDPYIVRYVGLRSVMYPSEDRTTILEVARRYRIDYLLMPANRPALDPLYTGAEQDARFMQAGEVPGTGFVFFAAANGAP